MKKYNLGNIIKVIVTAIEPYGAFVKIDDEYTGLIHISEITGKYINDIKNYISVGDILNAKIIDIDDEEKHIKLSLKNINFNRKNNEDSLKETDLGFFLLKDLLPKWIDDKLKEIEKTNK